MTPNQIESAKERINFLTRLLLAYIAGIYLLVGAIGKHLMDYLARDELVLSEFGIIPAVTIVAAIVLSFLAIRLYREIDGLLDRIGETPC